MMSYVCVLSNDNYLNGVLILNENLKHLSTKYSLLCLINKSISIETRNILDYFNINYKIIEEQTYLNIPAKRYNNYVLDLLNIFSLTEYKKIIYLNIDLLILENIDNLFDEEPISMPQNLLYEIENYNLCILIIEPNINDFNNLKNIAFQLINNKDKINILRLIKKYFNNINYLPKEYDVIRKINNFKAEYYEDFIDNYRIKYSVNSFNNKIENPKIIHFVGNLKPFMINNFFDDTYTFLYTHYLNIVKQKHNRYKLRNSSDLISVIVPIYNKEKYLFRCLNSILNQTYTNLEIILINDCSTDNSLNICLNYQKKDDRIKIVNNKTNLGVSASRNIGLDIATGNYIGFIDADDYVEKNMYEILLCNIKQYNFDFMQCGIYIDNKEIRNNNSNIKYFIDDDVIVYYLAGNFISNMVWDKIFKKETIGNKRFNVNYKKNEDTQFIFDIISDCKSVGMINNLLYYYSKNNPASLSSNFSMKADYNLFEIVEKVENYIKDKYPKYIKLFYCFKLAHLFYYFNNLNVKKFNDADIMFFLNISCKVKQYVDSVKEIDLNNKKDYNKLINMLNNMENNL